MAKAEELLEFDSDTLYYALVLTEADGGSP